MVTRARLAALAFALILASCASSGGSSPTATQPGPTATATGEVALHPEGTVIFLRVVAGEDGQAFFVANADGTDEQQLTEVGEHCCLNRISPDRTHILTMPGGAPPTPITGGLLTIDGGEFTLLNLTDPDLNLVPQAWSSDGSMLAFEGWDFTDPTRTGIYLGAAGDVTEVVRLTSTDGAPHDLPLDFSPDGSKLLFYRAVRGEPDFPIDTGGSLWVVNADGSDARQLDTPPPAWWARWSPDGSQILFASERLQSPAAIWTMGADGSGLTKVFEADDGGSPIDPVWSPDGTQIMFVLHPTSDRFVHEPNAIYVMRADGTGLTKLSDSPDFKASLEWYTD